MDFQRLAFDGVKDDQPVVPETPARQRLLRGCLLRQVIAA
jgi:hypothetical protein